MDQFKRFDFGSLKFGLSGALIGVITILALGQLQGAIDDESISMSSVFQVVVIDDNSKIVTLVERDVVLDIIEPAFVDSLDKYSNDSIALSLVRSNNVFSIEIRSQSSAEIENFLNNNIEGIEKSFTESAESSINRYGMPYNTLFSEWQDESMASNDSQADLDSLRNIAISSMVGFLFGLMYFATKKLDDFTRINQEKN